MAKVKLLSLILACLSCLPLFPNKLFAQDQVKTGYDIYHNLLLIDDPQTPEQHFNGIATMAYMSGFADGLILMQDSISNSILPRSELSNKEEQELAKALNFNCINIPDNGIAVGQFILIYMKWAQENPDKLNDTGRLCLFLSLVDAFGWK